jgi:hypothetical protein
MKNYTIVWEDSALNDVARLLLEAPDRPAITAAVQRVESYLARNPLDQGTEIAEGLRVVITLPLRVIFSVRPDDRIVEVERVTWLGDE